MEKNRKRFEKIQIDIDSEAGPAKKSGALNWGCVGFLGLVGLVAVFVLSVIVKAFLR